MMPLGREGEREAAEAEMAAAKAALVQAEWRLEQKSVAAPMAARVQDTFFVEGEWVPAGKPVASLLPPGNVKARFYLPETIVGGIAIGRDVEIRCDGCDAPLNARVSYVSSQAEYTPPVLYSKESRAKLMFLAEARLEPAEGAKLRPGQPVDVRLK
jgi:HlyD family secretion protein